MQRTFTINEPFTIGWNIYRNTSYSQNIPSEPVCVQIEAGATATEWEPYTGGIPSPNPEYPQALESVGESVTVTIEGTDVQAQSLTVATPNGLPGIPVISGGNYKDANEQEWICDEVDFEKGVYVQRVGKQVLDGTQGRYSDSQGTFILDGLNNAVAKSYDETFALCTHYIYGAYPNTSMPELTFKISGTSETVNLYIKDSRYTTTQAWKDALTVNPVTVLYLLQEVVLYDLTAEELAQFAALHTNYPNTTIYNDAGAEMVVKYVADTKMYVDKKFEELAEILINKL